MRDALILLLFCFVCYPKLLAQQPLASVEGTVMNSTTAAPLSRVHLSLAVQNADEVDAPVYGALSDDAGHFSIAGIQPGVDYRLNAERPGFLLYPTVEQAPGGVILHNFKPGERLTGYRIEMAPRVTITGRVLDENGEPLPHLNVLAQRVPEAKPTHSAGVTFGFTDSRGMFRLSVWPQRYHIAVSPPSDEDERSEVRTDGSIVRPYLPTYYPSTLSRESAGVVDARAGAIDGIEIRALRSAMLHINGALSGLPPDATGMEVVLKSSAGMIERVVYPAADGQFAFTQLEPGTYRLYGQAIGADGPLRSPAVELKLANASLDFVPLPLSRGFDLRGTLAGLPAANIVELSEMRPDAETMPGLHAWGAVSADGSFAIRGIQPGAYEVEIRPLPDGAYVKSLRLGEHEVVDSVLDFRHGSTAGALAVTVSLAGGQISGSLENSQGEPLRRKGYVYLVHDGEDMAPRHVHGAETDSDGVFTVQGLAPGKYRMFATAYGITAYPATGSRTAGYQEWAAAADVIEIHEGDKLVKNARVVGAK